MNTDALIARLSTDVVAVPRGAARASLLKAIGIVSRGFEHGLSGSTWIEPVARAQAGNLPVAKVWREAIDGMPEGVRPVAAGGMDGTREWGRLYWGGATF